MFPGESYIQLSRERSTQPLRSAIHRRTNLSMNRAKELCDRTNKQEFRGIQREPEGESTYCKNQDIFPILGSHFLHFQIEALQHRLVVTRAARVARTQQASRRRNQAVRFRLRKENISPAIST